MLELEMDNLDYSLHSALGLWEATQLAQEKLTIEVWKPKKPWDSHKVAIWGLQRLYPGECKVPQEWWGTPGKEALAFRRVTSLFGIQRVLQQGGAYFLAKGPNIFWENQDVIQIRQIKVERCQKIRIVPFLSVEGQFQPSPSLMWIRL